MRYTQLTPDNVRQMLSTIGAPSVDDLFSTIPKAIRRSAALEIPAGVSELELLDDLETLASRNVACGRQVCFAGGGAYDHFIPSFVDALAGQSEFLTGYTPYQAEASQGILQLFFEFQTMVCQLTGMEVANASMYEVASATAEAAMMAIAVARRDRVVVASTVHPDTQTVLKTYCGQRGVEVVTVPASEGVLDVDAVRKALPGAAAVIVQSPNFFGCLERLDALVPPVHAAGAWVIAVADPIASGVLRPPGAFGVDLVVAEGQPLGIPLQYGGPYLGLMAGREAHIRKLPGRVVGQTTDADGRRAFCLVLQTREQHIKRERATSNICTNQGLLAVRAAIYLAGMGRQGLGRVAQLCFQKSHDLARRIAALEGYELRFAGPFFKEFTVRTKRGVHGVMDACRERGILAGVPLAPFDERLGNCFTVAVTEKRTRREMDDLIAALKGA